MPISGLEIGGPRVRSRCNKFGSARRERRWNQKFRRGTDRQFYKMVTANLEGNRLMHIVQGLIIAEPSNRSVTSLTVARCGKCDRSERKCGAFGLIRKGTGAVFGVAT